MIQAQKGTKDVLPQEAYKWHYVEGKLRKIAEEYGCREIRTPAFEATELFTRGVGETTDVVQKEMYTFEDKGGRSITLKPEGTAPAVRAFIESSLYSEAQPTKLYYFTPVFRYENVQKGRFREHHQFGVEVFGAPAASLDAETISLAMRAISEVGIDNLKLHINSIGCPKCRKAYNDALKGFLKDNLNNLCKTCNSRYEKNPMRILDCKEEKCKVITKTAPVILDYICDDCKEHMDKLKGYLEAMGISYEVDPYIVRGLDYYSKTVFEIINNDITVCGGGRYDYLIEQIGGPSMPAVGFGMGLERLIMTIEGAGLEIPKPDHIQLYIGSMGEKASLEAMKLTYELRKKGIKCDCDHMGRSVKAQMKYANKLGAKYSLVLGEDELDKRVARLKKMEDGSTIDINIDDYEAVSRIIKGE
ncbi:histidine--tRNA ligase [Clostridium thermarum]|uniref:histidine--tRNA ligase n=1 Tax=Clostridium thermarum TaxID=1716543 RepID=UPI0011219516|nr:histidine--tRNA ligase [Clostridium thermarum]